VTIQVYRPSGRPRYAAATADDVSQPSAECCRWWLTTRAELLRRLGRVDEARDAYRRARQLTDDGAERRFLERRLTELARTTGSG
jgi:RNA polymerase sigma-70 factor (ECF subfamily)